MLADQIEGLTQRIATLEHEIVAEVRRDDTMRRLATISGVGPITAATIVALVPDPKAFTSARHFAAWIGLTPKMHSTGGKDRLGRISKMGNPALRSLLVVGATAICAHARRGATASLWLTGLLARRPAKVVAIALANKMARIVSGASYERWRVYTQASCGAHDLTNWSATPPSTKGKVHSINDDLHGTTSR